MNVFIVPDEVVTSLFAGGLLIVAACFVLVILRQSPRITRHWNESHQSNRLPTIASLAYGVLLLVLCGFCLASAFRAADVGGMTIGSVLAVAGLCVIFSALTGLLASLPAAVATLHGILGLLLIPLSCVSAGIGGESVFHSHLRWMPVSVGIHIILPFAVATIVRRKKTQPKDGQLSSESAPCASPDEVSS